MIQPYAMEFSAQSDADERRPLHGRPSLGLTVEQFLCTRRRLKNDDLVIGVDVS
jgi:hypothetical protein